MGPVRIGAPSSFLAAEVHSIAATFDPPHRGFDVSSDIDRAVSLLADATRPLLFVGGGCRRSGGTPPVVQDLAEFLDAPVLPTYKGKGIVPDTNPRVLGVAASHLNAGGKRVLEHADVVLAIGTDFDGLATSDWTFPMGDHLIHVNVDAGSFGRGYVADVEIPADAATVGRAILDGLRGRNVGGWNGREVGQLVRNEYHEHLDGLGVLAEGGPAKTPATLLSLRKAIPEEAIVTTDIGGHRLWALQLFQAVAPERYITAGSWAGMGVGLPSAVGAAIAREVPVVSLHGDGGLLMCLQTLHTAVEYDLGVTLVVFVDGDYGIISKSPKLPDSIGEQPFAWDSPDFAAIADGFDCRATRVETPTGAAESVADAIDRPGPDVVVVETDPTQPSVVEAATYDSTINL